MTQRQHGTNACYRWGPERGTPDWRNGCRCQQCRTAANVYNVQLARRREQGIETLHDATPAREHLRWLQTQGVGARAVVNATGLRRNTVREIVTGETKRCRPETIEKILAVGTHRRRPGAPVDAARTWALIEELLEHGFTKTQIAAELGSTAERPALQIRRDTVLQSTADKVVEVHRRLMAPIHAQRDFDRMRQREYRARMARAAQ